MSIVNYQKVGSNKQGSRVWLESLALSRLGFAPGVPYRVETDGTLIKLRPDALGSRVVSSRKVAGVARPIIDLNSRAALGGIGDFEEVKVSGSHNLITISPSRRAFHIRKHRDALIEGRIPVIEFYAGGGTISDCLHADSRYEMVGVVEISPLYSDAHVAKFPTVPLYLMDARDFDPSDIPPCAGIFASLPCTAYSSQGITKKKLKGKSASDPTGDLFISLLEVVHYQMPLFVQVENVPHFGNSPAGQMLAEALRRLGYHVTETVLNPTEEWAEIQDRRRYVLTATLDAPFHITPPGTAFAGRAGDFLDPVDAARDRADAERIATTIAGLKAHNERHRAMGHGFGFTTIDHDSTRIPTICRSYHKINTGPFVSTEFGPRLLRQGEMERIFGFAPATDSYATAVEILGQGTLARCFRKILSDLADHIMRPRKERAPAPASDTIQPELSLA